MKIKKRYWATLLVTIPYFFLYSCMNETRSKRKIVKEFSKKNITVEVVDDTVFNNKQPLRYVVAGNKSDTVPLIVFVHGAPGSSDAFYKYMKDSSLLAKFRMLSVDRPGYGASGKGKSVKSIVDQTAMIAEGVAKFSNNRKIWVGHSFGGPIVARAAVDFPEQVNAVMMLAPAIDPEHEKVFWIAHLARWKATKWLVPTPMKVAGDEKFSHVAALEEIENDWAKVKVPIYHIHGTKDIVVPYANLKFSNVNFDPNYLVSKSLKKENHFLPWSRYDYIKHLLETDFLE